MFTGTDGHLLPLAQFLFLAFALEADFAALGIQHHDPGSAQLGGFLDRIIHALALDHGQCHRDRQRRCAVIRHKRQRFHGHRLLAHGKDPRGPFPAVPIEYHQLVPLRHAKHLANMMTGIGAQLGGKAGLEFLIVVKAAGHGVSINNGCQWEKQKATIAPVEETAIE